MPKTEESVLTAAPARDIIIANNGWLLCPYCRRKLLRVLPDTTARNLPVYCRKCSHESVVNISQVPAP